MSEPKRYQPVVQCVEPSYQAQMIEPKVMEFSEGEYVLHSDYARLKAEVERLTKAGDAMADAYLEEYRFNTLMIPPINPDEVEAWHAAKGVQS